MTEQDAIKDLEISCKCLRDAINNNDIANGYELNPRLDVFEISILALEKQIPKKITHPGCYDNEGVWHTWNGIDGVPYDLCPNCETNLCTDGVFGRDKKRMKYCENCGQKLDWTQINSFIEKITSEAATVAVQHAFKEMEKAKFKTVSKKRKIS